jgi:formylglycine-generating enzyme required for sulfatase activity
VHRDNVIATVDGGTGNPDGVDGGVIDSTTMDGGPEVPNFASCASLPSTCGNAANESCCTSPLLPAGTFDRGFDVAGDDNSGNPQHPATVSEFRLDQYEITVGRFRAFINAGRGTQKAPPTDHSGSHPNLLGSGWDANWNASLPVDTSSLIAQVKCDAALETWTDIAAGNENRPMNCMSWYEAMAFCVWDGGFLPTEAEWNYAATGGDQQRAFPWSSPAASTTIDASNASYFDGSDCLGDGTPGCTVTDLVMVGSKSQGNGRWGQADLSGNVMEWVLDWSAAYATPCEDCANLTTAVNRVVRGGSFTDNDDDLRSGVRIGSPPATHNAVIGARCARVP